MTTIDEVIDRYKAIFAEHERDFLRLSGQTNWTPALVARWQTSSLGKALGARAAGELFKLTEGTITEAQRARIDALLARRSNPHTNPVHRPT